MPIHCAKLIFSLPCEAQKVSIIAHIVRSIVEVLIPSCWRTNHSSCRVSPMSNPNSIKMRYRTENLHKYLTLNYDRICNKISNLRTKSSDCRRSWRVQSWSRRRWRSSTRSWSNERIRWRMSWWARRRVIHRASGRIRGLKLTTWWNRRRAAHPTSRSSHRSLI